MLQTIALVAHDQRKADLVDWVVWNWEKLLPHQLVCTGTTGRLIQEALFTKMQAESADIDLHLTRLKSGPLGGDQQLGARIAEGQVDIFVFFWDTMSAQPHDVDVKALLRLATLYNIPTATNRATADFLISSPLFDSDYVRQAPQIDAYRNRKL
ncbi:MAG: methylglyoxal synthase [Bacteroidota bacterium]